MAQTYNIFRIMKKTLLSILALSASVAFAQDFKVFPKESLTFGANKDYDTSLVFQGADCMPQEVIINPIFAKTTRGMDTVINVVQKFTYSSAGKISAGAVFFDSKTQGAVGGTTTYKLDIYDAAMNLLGSSEAVTFANIQTSATQIVPTGFTFTTPISVGTTFFAGIAVNDGVVGTDTVGILELYPFSGASTSNITINDLVGDCSNGSSFIGNGTLGYASLAQLSQVPAPNGFGVKLDPKLAIGVILEVEGDAPVNSIENNPTVSYSIFPNPTSDVLNVQYTLAKEGNVTMNITDLTGRTIKSIVKENQGTFQVTEQINIAGLNSGIYMLTVNANGNTTTQKFIVK